MNSSRSSLVCLAALCAVAGCSAHASTDPPSPPASATRSAPIVHRASPRQIVAWGANGYGQIGDGQEGVELSHANPFVVPDVPADPKQISAGDDQSLVLSQDGHVWSWGANGHGQVGDGSTIDRTSPVQLTTIDHVAFVAAGYFHDAVIRDDGTVWAWGENAVGELGQGNVGADSPTPVQVTGLPAHRRATKLSTGGQYTLALLDDGSVWGWGNNAGGQMGASSCPADPTQACDVLVTATRIAEVAALGRVVDMSGIGPHTMFVLHDGSVWTMGLNAEGQLGIGPQDAVRHGPERVRAPDGSWMKATMVAAGEAHSIALGTDGRVYGWGYDPDGQVGVPPAGGDVLSPQEITCNGAPCLRGATVVQAGHYSGEALVGGRVWAWGRADYGELGQIVACCSAVPLEVPGLRGVQMVSTVSEHTLAFGRYRPAPPACAHPSAYELSDLAPLPGDDSSMGNALNDEGIVVGISVDAAGNGHAVAWTQGGTPVALGALAPGAASWANAINDDGDVVGESLNGQTLLPVRYSNGTVTALPVPQGVLAGSTAIIALNGAGTGAGYAYFPDGHHALEFGAAGLIDLGHGLLGGSCTAQDINDSGQIIATSGSADGSTYEPTLFTATGATAVAGLAGTNCQPWGMNVHGDFAGVCSPAAGDIAFANVGGTAFAIPPLPGDSQSAAYGINAAGQVVGNSVTTSSSRAFLYEAGQEIDLASVTTNLGSWRLTVATRINDDGEILGFGTPDGSPCFGTQCSGEHAFLLEPVCP